MKGERSAAKTRYASKLQRTNTENSKQLFPEKEFRGLGPNFHIHVSLRDLYIPTIGLPMLLQEICGCGTILGIYKSLINIEMGTETSQFLFWEKINGIFVAALLYKGLSKRNPSDQILFADFSWFLFV